MINKERELADNIITAITGYTYARTSHEIVTSSFLSQLNTLLSDDVKFRLIKEVVKDKKERNKITTLDKLFDRFKMITNYKEKEIEDVEFDTAKMIRAAMTMSIYLEEHGLAEDFALFEKRVANEIKAIQKTKKLLVKAAMRMNENESK